jgi:hypothetical protein
LFTARDLKSDRTSRGAPLPLPVMADSMHPFREAEFHR